MPARPHPPALSLALECQILAICHKRAIAPFPIASAELAPSTLPELVKVSAALTLSGSGITVVPVWSGASQHTVWSSPGFNVWARAWHDYTHLRLRTPFDLRGEIDVALAQLREITGAGARDLQWVETAGQALHHDRHRVFPSDQRAFARCSLRNGIRCAIALGPF